MINTWQKSSFRWWGLIIVSYGMYNISDRIQKYPLFHELLGNIYPGDCNEIVEEVTVTPGQIVDRLSYTLVITEGNVV